jgi:error-prone DNA polymerase
LFEGSARAPRATDCAPQSEQRAPARVDNSRVGVLIAVDEGVNRSTRGACAPQNSSPLKRMNYPERIQADFAGMKLTTGKHPMALLRPQLKNIWRAGDLAKAQNGIRIRIAGNVICRQRPGTAKGFVFISLEDETGISNAIVTPLVFEANRLLITEEPFLMIEGKLQHHENVIHVKAEKIERLDHDAQVGSPSYDFH